MHMLRVSLALVLMAVLGFFPSNAGGAYPATPGAVVDALYHTSLDHFSGFDEVSVKRAKPYLTSDFYALILKKLDQPRPKDEAPDIEGDIFINAQEPASGFTIGKTTIDGDKAKVEVTVKWPDEKRHYTVLLLQTGHAWKVTDVDYEKDGTLRDLLK